MINFLIFLIIGGIIGWVAGAIMGDQRGVLGNIVLGILGGLLGGWLSGLIMNTNYDTLSIPGFIFAVIGAVILIAIKQAVMGKRG